MFNALLRALEELFSPPLRRVVMLSVAIAVACFIGLWLGVTVALDHLPTIGWRPVNWLIDLFGVAGVALLAWLLFPAVVTMITGFFLEQVAAAVEAIDYPCRGPPRRQSTRDIVLVGLRLMVCSVILNLLALPIYALFPLLNVALYLTLNGYLFGREYFELVALRRLNREQTRSIRRRFGARIFVGGVVIVAMFAVPIVNIVAPVIATAFMIHVFEELRYSDANGPQNL
jgi:CysZ protein